MRLVIFGAGKAGTYLYQQIKVHGQDMIVDAFIDSFSKDIKEIDGVPVCRPDRYLKSIDCDAVFLAAGSQKAILQMIQKVKFYNIDNIYMLQDIAGKNQLPLFSDGKLISTRVRKIKFSKEKPTLPYFEMPIVDSCNLNCKGCLFGCNRNGEQKYMSLEEIKKDLFRMTELFEDIPWIRILGGEPLLHPDLDKVMDFSRKLFPDAEIDLCTNGLLVPELTLKSLKALIKNKITVHISGYKPTYKMINKIEDTLKKAKLEYTVLKREKFYKFYTMKNDNDPKKSHAKCPSAGCRELYRGRLAKCSAALAFERLNKQFGTNYKIERNKDWFDIYDKSLTGWDIMAGLDMPASICSYCSDLKIEYFDWKNGEKESLEDYIISVNR
jgi:organic radical activating enzyme